MGMGIDSWHVSREKVGGREGKHFSGSGPGSAASCRPPASFLPPPAAAAALAHAALPPACATCHPTPALHCLPYLPHTCRICAFALWEAGRHGEKAETEEGEAGRRQADI